MSETFVFGFLDSHVKSTFNTDGHGGLSPRLISEILTTVKTRPTTIDDQKTNRTDVRIA
jgi:hypothetical protein